MSERASREAAILVREGVVSDREVAAAQREVGLDAQEALVRVIAERDQLLSQMRDANEQLVLTALRAQELTDEATTARAAAEAVGRELEETQTALRAADRRKDEFIAMLGHELRNPLAPILTAIELMKQRPDDASPREREVIERQVRHMVQLVDDLLDVSRFKRGEVALQRCAFELSSLVANALEIARPLVESRAQTLSVSVPLTGLVIDADPTRIAQVIANLVTNAAKYSEPGSVISLGASLEDGWVRLSVKDDGVGITAELLPSVFEVFVQAPQMNDRAQGGLGLGLTIVRALVEAHGGEVSAHSDGAGEGSEFVVRLPAVIDAVVAPGAVGLGAAERAQAPRRPRRILVVDDNIDAADMLADALRRSAYDVAVVYSAPDALRAATSFEPDVVVTDIGLPKMDGHQLAVALRKLEARRPGGRRMRLIAVTGYGQEADRRRSAEAGMDAHLVKPVDLDLLVATVLADTSISTTHPATPPIL